MVLENDAVVGSVNANRRHYEAGGRRAGQGRPAGWSGWSPRSRWPSGAGARPPARRRQGGRRGRRSDRAPAPPCHGTRGRRCRAGHAGGIAPGVLEIDTLLGGWERVTAGYLIEGPAPVLIETGSQSSVPVLLAALDRLGLGPDELAGVAVTHIHLDHAGGVGDVARAFPNATVYVHEKGARHLADPTRLVDSAARVYGPLLDSLYGRLDPTPADASTCWPTARRSRVGPGRVLVAVDSPGHAKHHVGLHDSSSGILFAGDAVGVRLPDAGVLRPSTPPPDFDLDQALHSLRKFAARRPTGIALAHYGLLDDPTSSWPRPRDAAAVGRDGRGRPTGTARTSPPRWPPVRRRARRRARGAPGEARDAERRPLQRRRVPALARDAGPPAVGSGAAGSQRSFR